MSDRTYTRFTIPLSALREESAVTPALRILGIPHDQWRTLQAATPTEGEAAGHDCIAIRVIDDARCLVVEDGDENYGGIATEDALIEAGIPFIQVNGAGDEYGPTSTVFDGTNSETIRIDHGFEPVVAAGMLNGHICADPGELADLARYLGIRHNVLRQTS
jgi:hypothetical protein